MEITTSLWLSLVVEAFTTGSCTRDLILILAVIELYMSTHYLSHLHYQNLLFHYSRRTKKKLVFKKRVFSVYEGSTYLILCWLISIKIFPEITWNRWKVGNFPAINPKTIYPKICFFLKYSHLGQEISSLDTNYPLSSLSSEFYQVYSSPFSFKKTKMNARNYIIQVISISISKRIQTRAKLI